MQILIPLIFHDQINLIDLEDRHLTPGTFAMYSVGVVGILLSTALSLLPFVFSNTPATVILKIYLPNAIMDNQAAEKILSSLYWLINAYFAVIPIMQHIAIVILVLCDSADLLKPGYNPKVELNADSRHVITKVRLRNKKGMGAHTQEVAGQVAKERLNEQRVTIHAMLQFPAALSTYRQAALICKSFQSFGFIMFPSLILIAFLICVVCTFVCVRLNDTLPAVLVGIMEIIDIIIFINTIFIYGFALNITTETQKFIGFWGWKLHRLKHKKLYRTCSVIHIWVGSFFAVQYSIVLDHVQQVVENTTNLLLM